MGTGGTSASSTPADANEKNKEKRKAGAYMAYTKPKETKKMLRKATQNAEKALTAVDKMVGQYF